MPELSNLLSQADSKHCFRNLCHSLKMRNYILMMPGKDRTISLCVVWAVCTRIFQPRNSASLWPRALSTTWKVQIYPPVKHQSGQRITCSRCSRDKAGGIIPAKLATIGYYLEEKLTRSWKFIRKVNSFVLKSLTPFTMTE